MHTPFLICPSAPLSTVCMHGTWCHQRQYRASIISLVRCQCVSAKTLPKLMISAISFMHCSLFSVAFRHGSTRATFVGMSPYQFLVQHCRITVLLVLSVCRLAPQDLTILQSADCHTVALRRPISCPRKVL